MRNVILLFIIAITLASCGNKKPKNAASLLSKLPESPSPEASYDNPVKTLGIGLVKAPNQFDVYDDSLLTRKYLSVDMQHDSKIKLAPKYSDAEYGIMHFVCISKSDKAYKVLVNFATEKYLPKLKRYDFVTWEGYITQSFGVRRIGSKKTPPTETLNITPGDSTKTLTIPKGYEMFCPMQVKGDWLQVTYDCFYNDEHNKYEGQPCQNYIAKCKSPLTGWLRWRRGETVLIDVLLTN
jgi:hypothetical protein